jgi:uncharacterized protein (TIGR03435 family)
MGRTNFFPRIALVVALVSTALVPLWPQPQTATSTTQSHTPDWQIAAGGKMAFDSASVVQNTARSSLTGSDFPLGPGDVYNATRGRFGAKNLPLVTYIFFAYKITNNQEEFMLSQLPKWVITDRFDVQANAEGNPTKDQMRLMMQALLADHFRLAVHYETRQVPVYALLVDQTGKLGPLLQKHTDDLACPEVSLVPSPAPAAPPQGFDRRFPAPCGGIVGMVPSAPGRLRSGARNVSMKLIASSLTGGLTGVDRPVLDQTNLTGMFDFAVEFTPQYTANSPLGPKFQPDPSGPTFVQALKEQLGLTLEAQMGPQDFLIIDYIEEPLPK